MSIHLALVCPKEDGWRSFLDYGNAKAQSCRAFTKYESLQEEQFIPIALLSIIIQA
jgi:hypothetical protein